MVKKFTIPFASQGDANDIPDALQVDGKVSFTQGFGYDYERPYDDPQAKDIAREDMNGLFKAITSAVGELQMLGASEWSSAVSYPKGAIVYYEKDLYVSQVDDNQSTPPQNWTSIKNIADDSLKKAANLSDLTNKATARNNLGLGSSATLNKTDVLGTSTSLVATQKLVNDTKINLENSKQDKLEFVGSGKVMREGAGGMLGSAAIKPSITTNIDVVDDIFENGSRFSRYEFTDRFTYEYSAAINVLAGSSFMLLTASYSTGEVKVSTGNRENNRVNVLLGSLNTTTDSNGVLFSGSTTVPLATQSWVKSKALGIDQTWKDMTSQRVAGTTYTNSTGKPISVYAHSSSSAKNFGMKLIVGGVVADSIAVFGSNNFETTVSKSLSCSAIVPHGSTYRYEFTGDSTSILIDYSSELR